MSTSGLNGTNADNATRTAANKYRLAQDAARFYNLQR
jgi:hypothetical protein